MKLLPYLLLSCMAWGQAATLVKNPPCLDSNGIVFQTSGNVARPTGTPLPMCEWVKPVAPEAVDVPAIKRGKEEVIRCTKEYLGKNKDAFCEPVTGWIMETRHEYWTCADKSRILLTDESGGKHCIKFAKD